MKQRFVLDTSAFTGLNLEKKQIEKHILNLIKLISTAKKAGISCYTPPSVWTELKQMLENKGISKRHIHILDVWLIQKAPSMTELMVPSEFLYDYVGEVRERFNKGLREAEKAVLSKGGNRPDEIVIKELREKYKTSMRQGILDSKEDLDILLLAKELNAGVVANDEGIQKWAKKWGIRLINCFCFPELLREYSKNK